MQNYPKSDISHHIIIVYMLFRLEKNSKKLKKLKKQINIPDCYFPISKEGLNCTAIDCTHWEGGMLPCSNALSGGPDECGHPASLACDPG